MRRILIATLLSGFASLGASSPSPYVGEEERDIKALSHDEIQGLLNGKGMGFAKTAELNHYPGPRHVLDLAEQLHLSSQQIGATNTIFNKMQSEAIQLGKELVSVEEELDELFSSRNIFTGSLGEKLFQIGAIQEKLRGVHLSAHLKMRKLLSTHQIMTYDKLRGYSDGNAHQTHSH